MEFLKRSGLFKKPNFAKNWRFNPHVINIIFILVVLVIAGWIVYIGVSAHGQRIATGQPIQQGSNETPAKENTAQNVYSVGQEVYCYDSNGSNGSSWYPCKIIGVEDNHAQYFVQVTESGKTYMWHSKPSDITAGGTYKGAY